MLKKRAKCHPNSVNMAFFSEKLQRPSSKAYHSAERGLKKKNIAEHKRKFHNQHFFYFKLQTQVPRPKFFLFKAQAQILQPKSQTHKALVISKT